MMMALKVARAVADSGRATRRGADKIARFNISARTSGGRNASISRNNWLGGNSWLVEALGYTAAAINVFVYVSNSMVPLRIAAIFANGLFASYFSLKGVYPLFLLIFVLMVVNVWRLRQLQHLIEAMRLATQGDFNLDWLRPFMRAAHLPAETSLYHKGDLSEEAYVITRGAIELPKLGVTLGVGALFGELGLFTDENRRTASAVAVGETELFCIKYSDVLQLAAQNPRFGFYLIV